MKDLQAALSSAPAIRIENATVEYAGDRILDGLSLTLAAGQWTCLLGPSGVGKTSLLRAVAGLLSRTEGTARVSASDGLPLAGRMAWMAQQDLLLPWLTVQENVLLGPRLRGEQVGRLQRERASALLEDLGLGASAGQLPSTLSGGMRQRAALARTLYEDTPVVLMDEPFSALDAITRHRLQDVAAERLAGRTVMMITHDPMEAVRLGHVILVLSGRPARLATPFRPEKSPPRAVEAPEQLAHYATLLRQLTQADAAIGERAT